MGLKHMKTDLLPNPFEINVWGTKVQLGLHHVEYCMAHGLVKTKPLLPDEDHTDVMLHAMRVAFFAQSIHTPSQLDPVFVETQYTPNGDEYLWVMDGNHYLAAAIYSGKAHVVCVHTKQEKTNERVV